MIYAFATQYKDFVSLEVVRPDKIEHDFIRVADTNAAKEELNTICRDLIIAKLTGWLRQRTKGLEKANQVNRSHHAAKLGIELNARANYKLHVVMRFVADHGHIIESLAPSPSAGHYSYYQETILKILKYCRGEEV